MHIYSYIHIYTYIIYIYKNILYIYIIYIHIYNLHIYIIYIYAYIYIHNLHYRSNVWGHPDNFVFSMKTHTYLSDEYKIYSRY